MGHDRVVFLDIDGPIIPYSFYLIDRNCSFGRNIPPIPVAVVKHLCKHTGARVVFNTTHNLPLRDRPDIDEAMVLAGLPRTFIHADMKTVYPGLRSREDAVNEWLARHPETTDWVAFDDARFTDKDNLIWVDPDGGLHTGHLNVALARWNCMQFLVL